MIPRTRELPSDGAQPGAGHADAGRPSTLTVNGTARALSPSTTVADLVAACCASPDGIAVARNGEVVPRSEWAATTLDGGDRVEIVTAAAGG